MAAKPWRVVLVSVLPPAIEGFIVMLRELGHAPVALVTRPRIGFPDVSEILGVTPPELDVLVPSARDRLAPFLRACEPDLLLCVAFPWLLPADALAVPRLGAVNVHPSLLPRYRGPNPVGWTFRNDDSEIGLTFHRMDDRFDTGPLLAQGSAPLTDDDHAETIGLTKLAPLAAQLLPEALARVAAGDPGDPQPDEGATYAGLFEDEWVEIDWTRTARQVHSQVRSWLIPSAGGRMGPLTELDGDRVRVTRTELDTEAHGAGPPGEVLRTQRGRRLVQCGDRPLWVVATEPVE